MFTGGKGDSSPLCQEGRVTLTSAGRRPLGLSHQTDQPDRWTKRGKWPEAHRVGGGSCFKILNVGLRNSKMGSKLIHRSRPACNPAWAGAPIFGQKVLAETRSKCVKSVNFRGVWRPSKTTQDIDRSVLNRSDRRFEPSQPKLTKM